MTKRDGQQSNALAADARSEPARVLLVADELAVGDRAAAGIEDRADRFEVTRAEDAAEGLSVVDRKPVDCVVSGYDLPGWTVSSSFVPSASASATSPSCCSRPVDRRRSRAAAVAGGRRRVPSGGR